MTPHASLRLAGFAAAIAMAWLLQRMRPHTGGGSSLRVNLGVWAVNGVVMTAVCGACACAAAQWAEAQGLGLLRMVPLPVFVGLPFSVAALDLVSYLWHRANHCVPFLWRFHSVHHSDDHFTVSTALRFHPGELLLSLPIRLVAVVALGISPGVVVAFEIVFALANFVEHGDIALPVALEQALGRVVVVPAFHRHHHSTNAAELNSNFGTILIVWDRWLGTFGASTSLAHYRTGLASVSVTTLAGALWLPLRTTGIPAD
jgi:sterol desaturase/sphingolipid hydroxylase (fatty acid hydroxylase superfamily)